MRATIASLLALAILSAPGGAVLAADPGAHSHGTKHPPLTLNRGNKWPTDAPLRTGMARIRADLASTLPAIHGDRFSAADFRDLATDIEGHVAYMIENCRLGEDADAVLHRLIAEILEGAAAMRREGAASAPGQGAAQVVAALNHYGRLFDDPGWTPLEHR